MLEFARWLPTVNACLNGLATILLISGYIAIKNRAVSLHRQLMYATFGTSVLFLTCYLIYHSLVLHTPFRGTGISKTIYLGILITHVVLAAAVPILAIRTIWFARNERWEAHRRLAKVTFPIWLYVSVTGVLIYWMVYHWPVEAL